MRSILDANVYTLTRCQAEERRVKRELAVFHKAHKPADVESHLTQTYSLRSKRRRLRIALVLFVAAVGLAVAAAISGYYLIAALIVWVISSAFAYLFILGASRLSDRDR